MDQAIECAPSVEDTSQKIDSTPQFISLIIDYLCFLFYHVTAHIPRPMPRNQEELQELKWTLIKYYDLENEPQTWYTVAGQMTATFPTKTRKAYSSYVNAARRLKINAVAQNLKDEIIDSHHERIKKITENIIASEHPVEP